MFSYRHAFHAGNHADVLKHTVLIAVLKYLTAKDAPLAVFDTHAGAGLYRLDGDYAQTSGEAKEGFLRLVQGDVTAQQPAALPPALQDYVDLVASFNAKGSHKVYPGSPFITQSLLRPRDKLKLFELHPTDIKSLAGNIAQLEAGRQIAVLREDGFEGLRRHLPPPQRRALVLMDPSYEIKSDYHKVEASIADALTRFATGTYIIWYPIVPRHEAHSIARRLKSLATQRRRGWLHATLALAHQKAAAKAAGAPPSGGLRESGVVIINPPHTLKGALSEGLATLDSVLGDGTRHLIETSPT
jgi:23S rRNA (adenine2030-N6)-methyltransferase